jgi:AraC-like DNA-binding protein
MYQERASMLPGVVAWRVVQPATAASRVLPDGCLDIIWHDGEVFVAGPDTTAQVGTTPGGSRFAALRFAGGTGPAVLGLPACELTDRRVPLDDLWPAALVRRLAAADDPAAALEAAVSRRWLRPDPLMVAVQAWARAGWTVNAMSAACGLSERHLHRRCLAAFGYGPKMLTRILRMRRALALARGGRPFAEVAALAGYADQAHLSRDVRRLTGVTLGELLR